MPLLSSLALASLLAAASASAATHLKPATSTTAGNELPQQPIALLLPDPQTHTKLVLQEDAVHLLRGALRDKAFGVVSVVGAYRTGKSFLLNELMGVGCDEGFTVGHQRHTQTKGIWVLPKQDGNGTLRLFMDTEGFEGTGQAEVYDDRIFAFAALVSSVLVYNLAETIKQADIERLAFASQLSQEFWRRAQRVARNSSGLEAGARTGALGGAIHGGGAVHGKWRPPALLWLVQRDFLEGGSVEAYLRQALAPTAGTQLDEHALRLNKVREALTSFERMKALGLPQPHVRRTELCSLPRANYDPGYLDGAAEVKGYVYEQAAAARAASGASTRTASGGGGGGGGGLRGEEFAALTTKLVAALNAHELPSAGSVVDSFNAELVRAALDRLVGGLRALVLPLSEAELQATFEQRLRQAVDDLVEESFGATDASDLEARAREALQAVADANFVASQRACDQLWTGCQARLKAGSAAWLPSTSRYAARVDACNRTLDGCVGPAAARFHAVLLPQLATEGKAEYSAAYHDRLHRALVALSVAGILAARFCVRSALLELTCALTFVLLELLPALLPFGLSTQLVWGSSRVERAVDAYESFVFNEYWDLEELLPYVALASTALFVLRRVVHRRRKWRSQLRGGGGADLAQVVVKGE